MYKNLCIGSALLCTSLAFSQQAENEMIESLDEVVLIDSKFELNRENSGKVITRITAEDLEKSRGQSLPEVINRVSGIEINGARSNKGQNLGYYVRGGRNREVVIMVDGVQLNDASSIANDFDLRLLALDQVASIEIIKGASSTLYGSGAATAVINIVTKEPVDRKIGFQYQSMVGTNNTSDNNDLNAARFEQTVGLSGRLSKFNYQFNFSNRYTGDMSSVSAPEGMEYEDNPFRKNNLYARLGYKISPKLQFYFFGNLDKFNSSFDDSFMYEDADNRLISSQLRTGSHWVATYNKGSFIFSDSYTEFKRELESDYPNKFDGKVYAFDAHNKYVFNRKFYTIIGVNGIFSEFNSYNIPFGETDFSRVVDANEANFDIVDPYLNVVYISDFGLNINAGTRMNNHSEYGSHWVYNFNPSFVFNTSSGYLKVLSSYSTAYITPSLYQLYDAGYGNPELSPEESSTLESGLEYKTGIIRLSSVYFTRNSTNYVDFVVIDPASFTYRYENIVDEFNADGIELEIDIDISPNIDLSANYTFTQADERFGLRIPKHKINASLNYRLSDKTTTSLTYQFNDKRTDSYYNSESFQNELILLDNYHVLDFFADHMINRNLSIFAGITNITNSDYEEIYRFNTLGRNVRAGLVFNF